MFRLKLLYDTIANLVKAIFSLIKIVTLGIVKLFLLIFTSIAIVITYIMVFSVNAIVETIKFVVHFIYKFCVLLVFIIIFFGKFLWRLPKNVFLYISRLLFFIFQSLQNSMISLARKIVRLLKLFYRFVSSIRLKREYFSLRFFFKVIRFIITRIILMLTNIVGFIIGKIVLVLQAIFANEIFAFIINGFVYLYQFFVNIYSFIVTILYNLLLFIFNTLMFTQSMIIISIFIIKGILFILISLFTATFWRKSIRKINNSKFVLNVFLIQSTKKLVIFIYKEFIIFIRVTHLMFKSLTKVILLYYKIIRNKVNTWLKKNLLSFFTLIYILLILGFGGIYFLGLHEDTFAKITQKSHSYAFFNKPAEIILKMLDSDLLKPVRYSKMVFQVPQGKSLYDVLRSKNVDPANIVQISKYLNQYFNLRNIKSNWDISAILVTSKNWEYAKVQNLYIPISNKQELVIEADSNYNYLAYKRQKKLSRYIIRREFHVDDSIYQSAKEAGVPNSITYLLFKIMSWDVDFQREIQSGDIVEVVFECLYNQNNELVTCDQLLFGHLKLSTRSLTFYKFNNDYYHENGNSVVKALLKTPFDHANTSRISSPFGWRKHPILGYTLLHKGVDFAGPVGSKIYASGDGVIVKEYKSASYGNYIKVKHNDHLSSAYAHMRGFAKGTYVGKRVKQWDTIGYIGATGRVTGPHLHYEILVNNKAVNPLTVRMPSNTRLKPEERKGFDLYKTSLNTIIVRIPSTGMILTPYARDSNGNIIKDTPVEDGMRIVPTKPTETLNKTVANKKHT
ncbi:peptidoglycan DD-metalloendopeptidase family protein [Candidatus Hepatincola sp. Av]